MDAHIKPVLSYSSSLERSATDKPKTENPQDKPEKPKPQGVPKPGVIIRPVGD